MWAKGKRLFNKIVNLFPFDWGGERDNSNTNWPTDCIGHIPTIEILRIRTLFYFDIISSTFWFVNSISLWNRSQIIPNDLFNFWTRNSRRHHDLWVQSRPRSELGPEIVFHSPAIKKKPFISSYIFRHFHKFWSSLVALPEWPIFQYHGGK